MNPWNWDIHYVADRRGFASDALEWAPTVACSIRQWLNRNAKVHRDAKSRAKLAGHCGILGCLKRSNYLLEMWDEELIESA